MGLLSGKTVGLPGIHQEPYYLKYYSADASGCEIKPQGVLLPRNASEICDAIKHAIKQNVPVTARGGGTGLVGGSLIDGIVLDVIYLNQIRFDGARVWAEAGVYRRHLDAILTQHSRLFGPNPSVGPYCTVGGMIATNAAGSRSLRYGSVIDNLEAITVVDGQGNLIRLPEDKEYASDIAKICADAHLESYPDTTKNSCGYRLDAAMSPDVAHRVIAASEGTLGIIVSAVLQTHQIPDPRYLVLIRYKDGVSAALDCPDIARLVPLSLEIVGPGLLPGLSDTQCMLFVEFDTNPTQQDTPLADIIHGHIDGIMAGDETDLWWRRRNAALSTALQGGAAAGMTEDAAVPLRNLPRLFEIIDTIWPNKDQIFYFGHAGNGNIHLRFRIRPSKAESEAYLEKVISLGGTVTGEHGDGMIRTHMVRRQYDDDTYSLFVKLKALFDPHNILNPGRIVDLQAVAKGFTAQ